MKNQYFGDRRDYFKYDVLERLANDLADVDRLTSLWMLTRPDSSGQGRVPFVPDPELPELTAFFRERLDSEDAVRRRVTEMRTYFEGRPFRFFSYRDDRDDFDSITRSEYFACVPDEALQHAVVFFDPDNGMEPRRATERHLRFQELESILTRMDETSVAVVFQYWRRVRDFWTVMAQELGDRLGHPLAYIADPTLAFYVIVKSAARRDEVQHVLEQIAVRHTPGISHRRLVSAA
jgi:hypothetical protein